MRHRPVSDNTTLKVHAPSRIPTGDTKAPVALDFCFLQRGVTVIGCLLVHNARNLEKLQSGGYLVPCDLRPKFEAT